MLYSVRSCLLLSIILQCIHNKKAQVQHTHTHAQPFDRNWFEAVKCSIWLTRGSLSGINRKVGYFFMAWGCQFRTFYTFHSANFGIGMRLNRYCKNRIADPLCLSACMSVCVRISNYFLNFTHQIFNIGVLNQLLPQSNWNLPQIIYIVHLTHRYPDVTTYTLCVHEHYHH